MFLILASILLLVIIAVQNYLYPPLRQETISDGLFGPYHWWLDGAYVILAVALCYTFAGWSEVLASVAAASLMVTAVSNTFSTWVDRVTGGLHVKIHSIFTIILFLSMLGLQAVENHGSQWIWTAVNLAAPAIVYLITSKDKSLNIAPLPAAEKMFVLFLCVWLIGWSLQ